MTSETILVKKDLRDLPLEVKTFQRHALKYKPKKKRLATSPVILEQAYEYLRNAWNSWESQENLTNCIRILRKSSKSRDFFLIPCHSNSKEIFCELQENYLRMFREQLGKSEIPRFPADIWHFLISCIPRESRESRQHF